MNDYWQTPSSLFLPYHKRFDFTLDPCATHENHLTYYYYCDPSPQFHEADEEVLLKGHCLGYDGLTYSWTGERVWTNPPYSRGQLAIWLEKAAYEAENGALVACLIPHDSSTRWWQHFVSGCCDHSDTHRSVCPYGHQPVRHAKCIEELPQRVRFIDPAKGVPTGSPAFASAIAWYW